MEQPKRIHTKEAREFFRIRSIISKRIQDLSDLDWYGAHQMHSKWESDKKKKEYQQVEIYAAWLLVKAILHASNDVIEADEIIHTLYYD